MNIKDAFKANYVESLSTELKSVDVPELSVGDDKFKVYYQTSINGEHFAELMMLFEKGDQARLMFTAFNRLGLKKDGSRMFKDLELNSMLKGGYAPSIVIRVGSEIINEVFGSIETIDDAKKP